MSGISLMKADLSVDVTDASDDAAHRGSADIHSESVSMPAEEPVIVDELEQMQDPRFASVDARLRRAIADGMFPGCQVLVMKNGEIVYNKAFGTHTFGCSQRVELTDLYDVASIAKIASTTLALMKLHDEGKFRLDDRLSQHLTYLRRTNKSNMTIRQVMAHQAGLRPSIATHKNENLFRTTPCSEFSILVAPGVYTSKAAQDTLRREIVESTLLPRRPYRYSDMGFFFMGELVRELSGKPLDEYVEEHFYKPLGLTRTAFNPTQRFPLSQIVPTENDTAFRRQLIHGFVHDPTVAMLGGVGGSAGLFSNVGDLAIIMQMLLNGGEYNGQRYITRQTIDLFTQRILPNNRRGAGFDKPVTGAGRNPAADSASPRSFGHSGFTGTIAWADPANQMVYIFLSNRVHPTAANNLLLQQSFRPELQQMFYDILR
jgi:CubicO group peptidase (beta-lactamase class C family)